MRKTLRKPIVSAETGGKGCQKSCDVRKRAENIGEPRKSLLRDSSSRRHAKKKVRESSKKSQGTIKPIPPKDYDGMADTHLTTDL